MQKFPIPFFALIFLTFFASTITFAQTEAKQQIITKTLHGYKIEVKQGNKTQVREVTVRPGTSADKQSKSGTKSSYSLSAMNTAAAASGSCPADVTVNNDAGKCGAVVNYTTPTCIPKTYTQSASNNVEFGTMMGNCAGRYFRAYNLPALGITHGFTVSSVNFGAVGNFDGKPVTVNIYQWNPSTALSYANFTLVNSAAANIGKSLANVVSQSVNAFIPAGFAMIVEIVGNGTDFNSFYQGGNQGSQTAPSYYSLTCDANQTIYQDYVNYVINPIGCDASATIIQTQGLSSGSFFPAGTTTNTFKASDGPACSFNITVTDNEPPAFTTPDNQNVSLDANCSITVPDFITGLRGSDNCGGTVTFTQSPVSGTAVSSAHNKTTTVTITAKDSHGNTTSHNVTLTAKDNTVPTITAPAALTVSTDAGICSASSVTLGTPATSDNCTVASVSSDAPAVFPKGTTTVTWTATDAAGNKATATQTVTVQDKEAPVVPDLTTIKAECSTTVTATSGTDNCDGSIVPATTDPLSYSAQGTYTIHWTYSDANGNTALKDQTIIIKDVTKPVTAVATLPDITGECSAIVTSKPTATDNCAGKITATTGDALTYSTQGTYTITWTYDDGNGNTSTQTQNVIIKDITKPLITAPAALTVSTDAGKCSATNVVLSTPITSDNCSAVIVTNDAPSVYPKGTTTIIWTAKDAAGNVATATQSLTVSDNEKPVITCPVAPVTSCYNASRSYAIAPLQATDNCGTTNTTYTITGATTRSGTGNNASGLFNNGTSTITWTVTDGSGNFATCQTTVVINSPITVSIADVKVLSSGVNVNTVYVGYSSAATATLTATVSGGSGSYAYKWSTGATTATIKVSPAVTTTYNVTITDAKGCTAIATKQIKVINASCGSKVNVCHGGNTLCINSKDVPDHLNHGDYLGACSSGNSITMASKKVATTEQEIALSLNASPNPSSNYFKLTVISGDAKDKVSISITDELGRSVETKTANAGQTIQIGERYRPGIYFVKAMQANKSASVKLIKQ